jgi:hypothetical protein
MINIIIQKSHNPKNKYAAMINGIKTILLVQLVMKMIPHTKMRKEDKIILKDILMKIGVEQT